MAQQPLELSAADVPLNAIGFMKTPGNQELFSHNGKPLGFQKLIGTTTARMYPFPIPIKNGMICTSFWEVSDLQRDGYVFVPALVYAPDEAPLNGTYAPFADGERLTVETSGQRILRLRVVKTGPDTFYAANFFPFATHGGSTRDALKRINREHSTPESKVEYINEELRGVRLLEERNLFPKENAEKRAYLDLVVEALARPLRHDPTQLVSVLNCLDEELQRRYVTPRNISTDTQFVRVDRGAEQDFLRLAA